METNTYQKVQTIVSIQKKASKELLSLQNCIKELKSIKPSISDPAEKDLIYESIDAMEDCQTKLNDAILYLEEIEEG